MWILRKFIQKNFTVFRYRRHGQPAGTGVTVLPLVPVSRPAAGTGIVAHPLLPSSRFSLASSDVTARSLVPASRLSCCYWRQGRPCTQILAVSPQAFWWLRPSMRSTRFQFLKTTRGSSCYQDLSLSIHLSGENLKLQVRTSISHAILYCFYISAPGHYRLFMGVLDPIGIY